MRSTLVYDLPTRIFHWLFSTFFLISFVITKTVDDESMAFSYHMLSGLLLGGLVLWRIFWGFFGSKHARFAGFNLNLVDLKNYFFGIFSGSRKRWSGHNPASSWAAIIMFSLALGLAVTGYLMSTGSKEVFEDAHEFMADTFIVVVVLHIAGVILHVVRHQDAMALSMIDGKKETTETSGLIPSSRPMAAMLLLAFETSGVVYLFNNFDLQNRTLQLFGQTLQLGENEIEKENNSEGDENKSQMMKDEKCKNNTYDDGDDD